MDCLREKFFLLSYFDQHIITDIIPQIQIMWIKLESFMIRPPTPQEWDNKKQWVYEIKGTGALNRDVITMDNDIQFYQLCGSNLFKFVCYPDSFTYICKYNSCITYGFKSVAIEIIPCDLKFSQIWCPIKPTTENESGISYDTRTYFLYFPCK